MLRISDYTKVLQFTSEMNKYLNSIGEVTMFEILNENINFRKFILSLISQIFEFKHIAFFVTDENNLYSNPVAIANDKLMHFNQLYDQHYNNQNIFCFKNTPDIIKSKKILTISDVMPYNKDKYPQFIELLKTCEYNDLVTLPLRTNDQLLGAFVVYKPNNKYFTNKEIEILNILNEHLTQGLRTHLKISNYLHNQNVQKYYTANLSTGLIILDNNFSVTYSNNKAKEFCNDILNKNKQANAASTNIQQLIDKFYSKSLIEEHYEDSNMNIDIDNYCFKTSSFVILSNNGNVKTHFAINIVENTSNPNFSLEKISSIYNLTKREQEIVGLIVEGYTNKEISDELYISFNTVRTHVFNIFRKMAIKSRSEIFCKLYQIE